MSKNVDRLKKLHLVFVVVVLHRAYCIEAKAIFEGRSRNTRKILKSYSKVYKLVSQSRLVIVIFSCLS